MAHGEITDEELAELVERVREATGALMQGDVRRYLGLVNHAPDYTLMPPTGGPTRRGFDSFGRWARSSAARARPKACS